MRLIGAFAFATLVMVVPIEVWLTSILAVARAFKAFSRYALISLVLVVFDGGDTVTSMSFCEAWDLSGVPDGLAGELIPVEVDN